MKAISIKGGEGHRRNCVPLALTVVLDKPYRQVNNWLKYRGYRTDNSGTSDYRMNLNELGLTSAGGGHGLSVNQFSLSYQSGTYFVLVNHHGLAVKNGVVFDGAGASYSEKKIVKQAWHLSGYRLPHDWNIAQDLAVREEKLKVKVIEEKEQRKKRKLYYREQKKKYNTLKKTPEFKIGRLLKKQKTWATKAKRATTALKKIEGQLKRLTKLQASGQSQVS